MTTLSDITSLTPETIKRLENGYNVYTDVNYVAWLKRFHPDHLPPLGTLMYVHSYLCPILLREMYACELLLNL